MLHTDHVANKRIDFVDEGAGETLVFLHAFPLNHEMWRHQAEAFARRFRVLVPDLPGSGQSEPIQPWASPMDRMGDAVAELLENLRLPKAVFLGCSMGGYVALQLAQRYPHRVAGVVLSNTRANADSLEAKNHRELTARKVLDKGVVALEPMVEKLVGPSASQSVRDEVLAMIRAGNPPGAAAASRGMASRTDTLGILATFKPPVLVVRGAEDGFISADDANAMAEAAPNVERIEIPGAGHLAPLEQPEAWNAAVAAWLSRRRA